MFCDWIGVYRSLKNESYAEISLYFSETFKGVFRVVLIIIKKDFKSFCTTFSKKSNT